MIKILLLFSFISIFPFLSRNISVEVHFQQTLFFQSKYLLRKVKIKINK